jgi:hypothetical protein
MYPFPTEEEKERPLWEYSTLSFGREHTRVLMLPLLVRSNSEQTTGRPINHPLA